LNYYGGYQPQYGGGYQPQQQYGNPRMDFLQQTQQAMQPMPQMPQMNTGELQGRVVTGREEAVAAQVMPGAPYFFLDLAHGRAYVKRYDPQTGAAEFIDLAVVRPEAAAAPQFATIEVVEALRAGIEPHRAGQAAPPSSRRKGAEVE